MKRDDGVYLQHVLDSIGRIEEYLRGINEESFRKRHLIQDGVIRQLEIIGEAVKNVSRSVRDKHSEVPWRDIAGARDKLIHQYFGVDLEKVWLMARDDIPLLKAQIAKVIAGLKHPT